MSDEDQIEEEKVDMATIESVAPDSRFHSTNQAAHCWNLYNEWLLCMKKNNEDEDACLLSRHRADCACPDEWTEKWDEDRDEGKFTGLK